MQPFPFGDSVVTCCSTPNVGVVEQASKDNWVWVARGKAFPIQTRSASKGEGVVGKVRQASGRREVQVGGGGRGKGSELRLLAEGEPFRLKKVTNKGVQYVTEGGPCFVLPQHLLPEASVDLPYRSHSLTDSREPLYILGFRV